MKIIITGAAGMLGSDLVKAFLGHYDVRGIVRRSVDTLHIPVDLCDLKDPVKVQDVISRWKPGLIFHCAAMTNVDGCETDPQSAYQDNVIATQNVMNAANKAKSQIVFFSTDYVFDGQKKGEYLEEDAANPLNVYGQTKWEAEECLRRGSEKYVIFRVSWLYGLNGKSFPRTIIEKALTVESFKIVDDQVGRPTFTQDIAAALKKIMDHDKRTFEKINRQTFHLANCDAASWAEFAEFLLQNDGLKSRVEHIPSELLDRPAKRPKNSVLSLEKTREILGVQMRGWRESARDYIEQFKRNRDAN